MDAMLAFPPLADNPAPTPPSPHGAANHALILQLHRRPGKPNLRRSARRSRRQSIHGQETQASGIGLASVLGIRH